MNAILQQVREGILKQACDVVLVFSNKENAPGLQSAKKAGIETAFIPSKGKKREDFDKEVIALMDKYSPDYIILAGYMRLLSPAFIQAFKGCIINIHPADTRKFQGVGAYKWAYEQGLNKTAVTVHFVDEGMDTGDIIEQVELDISDCCSLEEVEKKGLALEHQMYSEVLKNLFENKQS